MKDKKDPTQKATKEQETQKKKRKAINNAAKAKMWSMKKMGF